MSSLINILLIPIPYVWKHIRGVIQCLRNAVSAMKYTALIKAIQALDLGFLNGAVISIASERKSASLNDPRANTEVGWTERSSRTSVLHTEALPIVHVFTRSFILPGFFPLLNLWNSLRMIKTWRP